MSRSLNSLSKLAQPQSKFGSFVPSQLLSRNISLRYIRTCVRPGPLLVVPTACVPLRSGFGSIRHYANGIPHNFPGLNLGQPQQKGDALKEYVRGFYVLFSPPKLIDYFTAERGFDATGKGRKTGSNYWKR